MTQFDPTKRCRAQGGNCQNLVSKKAYPFRLCAEHYDVKLERQARTRAQPDCAWGGCRQKAGQGQQYCGVHRVRHEERIEHLNEKAEMFAEIGECETVDDVREVLRRIVDRVWGEG